MLNEELSLDDIKKELKSGAKVILMLRHAERPKIPLDDETFGDALHLTREGMRTARLLGAALSEFANDTGFISSPLTRTRETAASVAEGMGLKNISIPVDGRLGNDSFFYEDSKEVLKIFNGMEFFKACATYYEKGELSGFRNLQEAADDCERTLDEFSQGKRLFVAVTHDCYVAAFLAARGAYGPFTRSNWVKFLDASATIVYPDGSRKYAIVRTKLSHGICGVRPTRGVVFDFGGVMTTSTMPSRVRAITDSLGIDWNILAGGYEKYRRLMDADFLSISEMYDLTWADAAIDPLQEVREKILKEDLASFLDGYRNEQTLAWMRELKSRGFKIGILTNMSTSMAVDFRKVYADFIELADAVVISGQERMFKPQARIYNLMRDRIALHSDEICFIDDVESNCEGARKVGWHAIRFENCNQARRDFEERFA